MRGTAVHQGLSDDRQTGVDGRALLNVEHTVWIGDHVHPEPQRQTRVTHDNVAIVTELYSELCKSVQHPKFEGHAGQDIAGGRPGAQGASKVV